MTELFLRTENILQEEILKLFVESPPEREIVEKLKSRNQIVLEGGRGTGKSFLFQVAVKELDDSFKERKFLPVYTTFMASTLLATQDENQFRHWMMAKIIRQLLKKIRKSGLTADGEIISSFSDYACTLHIIQKLRY